MKHSVIKYVVFAINEWGKDILSCRVIRVYDGFKELKVISFNEWNQKAVKDISEIKSRKLCPILSTAYGLAISTENDNIKLTPFRDIFKSMRGASEEVKNPQRQRPMGNFSYMDDYDAWK